MDLHYCDFCAQKFIISPIKRLHYAEGIEYKFLYCSSLCFHADQGGYIKNFPLNMISDANYQTVSRNIRRSLYKTYEQNGTLAMRRDTSYGTPKLPPSISILDVFKQNTRDEFRDLLSSYINQLI